MARIYVPATGECEFFDDIDFMAEARTIRFSLDGTYYEVDLSEANLRKLRDCLEPFIRFSRIVRRENNHHETTDIGFSELSFEDEVQTREETHGTEGHAH